MSPRREEPSWLSYLTIDLIVYCAKVTIFQPMFAWMLPLSLRALTVPYSDISFKFTLVYATAITLFWVLRAISKRIAFGSSREVDVTEELVVITGGASGLGLSIADFYRMKGAAVAVLDIKDNEDQEEDGVYHYHCDVGNAAEVRSVAKKIIEELGSPTILINNAAVVIGKSILDLDDEDIERSFKVNVLSQFHTVRAFLPQMLKEGHGTIVTVSSVLGYLGCAQLSDYTASKGALLAFHASLREELKHSQHPAANNIKTILVAPGQLWTPLFENIVTPSNFLAPVVEPIDLAKAIVNMVNQGDSGEIRTPFYAQWAPALLALPVGLQSLIRSFSGVDGAMISSVKLKDT